MNNNLLYPEKGYDGPETLFSVRNDSVSRLSADWNPKDSVLLIDHPELFDANGGFCTVYVPFDSIPVELRTTTYSYTGVSELGLTGVSALNNKEIARPTGAKIVGNIMAGHRNALVGAVFNLEKLIGNLGTEDESTLEWFTHLLDVNVKPPKPFFSIRPSGRGFSYTRFHFKDLSTRIKPDSWLWNFGDGSTSTEQNPVHVYGKPGIYDVSLKVSNAYGENEIVVRSAVSVLGAAIASCDVEVSDLTAISGETSVNLIARPAVPVEQGNGITEILWNVDGSGNLPRSNSVFAVFEKGGIFPVFVKIGTKFGNFSYHQGPTINVIERNSPWLLTQERYSREFRLEEFSPLANIWKYNHANIPALRDWSQIESSDTSDNFLSSGALHNIPRTFEALAIYSSDKSTIASFEIDCFSDVTLALPARPRGWGWISARTNWFRNSAEENRTVYLLFGHMDPDNPRDQSAISVESYSMTSKSWSTLSLIEASSTADDGIVLQEIAKKLPGNGPSKRIRSANWKDSIYIISSDEYGVMSMFSKFDPSTKTWKQLGHPTLKDRPLEFPETTLLSLSQGIYTITAGSSPNWYRPDTDSWAQLQGSPSWAFNSAGTKADPKTLLKSGSPSNSPSADGSTGYVTSWFGTDFTSYDEITKTVTTLPPRRSGYCSAMGVF